MNERKIRVMGFGTFDGIHDGHIAYIKQLRALGDEVILVVARDSSVKALKGRLPRHNETARAAALKDRKIADLVVPGHRKDFYLVLTEHKPDVIGLGYDQKADIAEIKKRLPGVRVVRMEAYKPEKFKSSLMNTKP